MFVGEARRQGISEVLIHRHVVGKAAVTVPPRESGRQAEILLAAPAVGAVATGLAEPSDTDSVPAGEAAPAETFHDRPYGLVAGDHPGVAGRKVALGEMEVGAADTAHIHSQEYLARPGPRVLAFAHPQRLVRYLPRHINPPCTHDSSLSSDIRRLARTLPAFQRRKSRLHRGCHA